jgi:hypothetical protein
VTDSGIYASDRTHAYIAFNFTDNGQTGSPWWSNKGSYPKWFTIKLEKKYVLTYAAVWNYWEAERFTEVQILGGNDGSSWSQLADWAPTKLGTNIYGAYNDISNAIGYQYYMFNFPSGPNSYIRCDSVILSGYLDN